MRAHTIILFAALFLTGLDAGFFYTWSFTVMPGLDAALPGAAVAAMNAVNTTIQSAWFAAIFFGAPLAAIAASVSLGLAGRRLPALLTAAGTLALAGLVAVTAGLHVPWNQALLTAPADADPAMLWAGYSKDWTAWNHLRTALGAAAFVLLALAFGAAGRKR